MRKPLSLLLLAAFWCCTETIEPAVDAPDDTNFYPTFPDNYRTYAIDEIQYEISGFDTSSYFLRERITDSIINGSTSTYILSRETRLSDTLEWQTDSVWAVRKDLSRVIITENNVPFVKLTFPVADGRTWDGNRFNTRKTDEYSYRQVMAEDLSVDAEIIAGLEMIMVSIEDIPANVVNQYQQWEVYGRNVGLVEKKSIILAFCTVDCDSAGQIESGRFFSQKLIDHGQL